MLQLCPQTLIPFRFRVQIPTPHPILFDLKRAMSLMSFLFKKKRDVIRHGYYNGGEQK